MFSKRILVQEILGLAGITSPRVIAAIAALADAKIEFGETSSEFQPEFWKGSVEVSIDGKPLSVEYRFRGPIVDDLKALLEGLFVTIPLSKPEAPVMMQISPSPKTDFLSQKSSGE